MRKLPSLPQESKSLPTTTKTAYPVSKYKVHVVTPMFGGGVQAGIIDTKNPIRSSAIRGQLRFWWRATRGAAFQNAYDLRKREIEIFGDTEHPSPIKIWVENVTNRIPKSYTLQKGTRPPYPAYLFQQKKGHTISYLENNSFVLCLQIAVLRQDQKEQDLYKELQNDINAALWAWINFGGIGSRTRRGCGSLYCSSFSPKPTINSEDLLIAWIKEKLDDFHCPLHDADPEKEWPTLSLKFKSTSYTKEISNTKGNGIWRDTIEVYRRFRQKKVSSDNPQGRSAWVEPDVLRKLTGMKEEDHKHPYPKSKSKDLVAFPRVQFGMPIITHFRQELDLPPRIFFSDQGEPYDTQLVPKDKNRLSSPVILKSIAVGPKQGFGVIIVLHQPQIEEVELSIIEPVVKNNTQYQHLKTVKSKLRKVRIMEREIYPKVSEHPTINYLENPMNGYSSAIEAFLNSEEVKEFCQHPTNRKS